MMSLARALPIASVFIVALGHAVAWTTKTPLWTWGALTLAYAPLLTAAVLFLRQQEAFVELLRPKAGDISFGIAGAAAALLATYAAARLGMRVAPELARRDLSELVRVAVVVPKWARAIAVVLFAVTEEVVWRGGVGRALESSLGSRRAAWTVCGLFAIAVVPSIHPSLIVAASTLGIATAILRLHLGRVYPTIIAHAAFTWLALEMILPMLWEETLRG